MRRILAGIIIGFILGTGATVSAATVVGHNGMLLGWSVTKDGEEICDSPYVYASSKEIECF